MKQIPIMKPLLPTFDKIRPYLERIDESRYYSNWGPLVKEYEARLEEKFGEPVVSASNCTTALTACLLATDSNGSINVPSWTFCATINAVCAAEKEPNFVETGVSCDLPVAALGEIINPCGAIAVDAAAGFDSYGKEKRSYEVPHVFSTHCTKAFCTGEGGFIVCNDKDFLDRVRVILNNGFSPTRSVDGPGINGKMSEYHAAVGLAELGGWGEKREKWLEIQYWYGDDKSWVNSTHHVKLDVPAALVVEKLAAKGVQARTSWYGCHKYPAYASFPQTNLSVTEDLMDKTIFLPKYIGMTKEDVEYVEQSLEECLA